MARPDPVVTVLSDPLRLECGIGHPQIRDRSCATADRLPRRRAIIVADQDVEDAAGLHTARLEIQIRRRCAPFCPLQLGLPGERLRIVLPLVAPLRVHVDGDDLARRVEPPEQKVDVLDLTRLQPVARADIILSILADPTYREPSAVPPRW